MPHLQRFYLLHSWHEELSIEDAEAYEDRGFDMLWMACDCQEDGCNTHEWGYFEWVNAQVIGEPWLGDDDPF